MIGLQKNLLEILTRVARFTRSNRSTYMTAPADPILDSRLLEKSLGCARNKELINIKDLLIIEQVFLFGSLRAPQSEHQQR